MAIRDWPKEQRPRERLITYGPEALSDPELMALFLRTGSSGKTAIELGREIIARFGSLNKLFTANPHELSEIKGLGPAKITLLQAVLELARRVYSEELKSGPLIPSSGMVKQFLQLHFAGHQSESFVILFLDVQQRLIACEKMFEGTLTRTSVYPREIIRRALEHNAAAAIFAHNHPSGKPEPSPLDKSLTAELKRLLHSVEVKLVDHIIVCGSETWSFHEHGLC